VCVFLFILRHLGMFMVVDR